MNSFTYKYNSFYFKITNYNTFTNENKVINWNYNIRMIEIAYFYLKKRAN